MVAGNELVRDERLGPRPIADVQSRRIVQVGSAGRGAGGWQIYAVEQSRLCRLRHRRQAERGFWYLVEITRHEGCYLRDRSLEMRLQLVSAANVPARVADHR